MAIETTIQLSENKQLPAAYVKVNTPRSFKVIENDIEVLKLAYDVEPYYEKGSRLADYVKTRVTDYAGGDIWNEAYTNEKTFYQTTKDV